MHQRLGRVLGLGLLASLAAGVLFGPTAAAASPFTFKVNYMDKCVLVRGVAGATGTIRQLASTGSVLESADITLDGSGVGLNCFVDWFAPGMKVGATIDGTTRTWTLPKLSIRVNRSTDVLSGSAPAGKKVKLRVDHYTAIFTHSVKTTSTTAGSGGTFGKDVTAVVNIAGGDRVEAIYTATGGDVLSVSEITPMVQVWVGRSQFGGHLLSGTGGTVTLRTSAGTFRASGPISFDGIDLETLRDSSVFRNAGTPKTARVGDKVSSALQSNISFKIPNLTIHVDSATDVISGACPAGRSLMWTVADGGNVIALNIGTCSGAGTYSLDTTADHDIVAGERVEVTARLATGDRVAIRKVAA